MSSRSDAGRPYGSDVFPMDVFRRVSERLKGRKPIRFTVFFMGISIVTGSLRLLTLKYHKIALSDENDSLMGEQKKMNRRLEAVKRDLLAEAELDHTGYLASRLHRLFANEE